MLALRYAASGAAGAPLSTGNRRPVRVDDRCIAGVLPATLVDMRATQVSDL